MNKFENLKTEDDIVIGNYESQVTGNITVEFDLEEDGAVMEDYSELISASETWIGKLTKEKLDELKRNMSLELTDSAYTGSGYKPGQQDYDGLAAELTLVSIRFFQDAFSLVFKAKKEYPDMLIWCQVDEDMEMEDLMVDNP
ncbi:hypothetical protein [Chitinophaga sp. YIM B06452]|uniref:hypothetical protein n=1 Tax=Chitinophaga sp. YIM B06452 TaxID=3082158 RepID=UPI0031FF0B19